MRLKVVPIDLKGMNGVALPRDPLIFEAAQQFCTDELVERPILVNYDKCWLVVEVNASGELVRPMGIAGYQLIHDVPLFRTIDQRATIKLAKRMNDFFADQGFRGRDVLLHISDSEQPEQRCPQYEDGLKAFGARPAERFIVRIT